MLERGRCSWRIQSTFFLFFLFQLNLLSLVVAADISTIPLPSAGIASLTHYDLPLNGYVASCGCGGNSSYYPTAAISQSVYGSSISSGPACGQCFNLTLISSLGSIPIYNITTLLSPSIVVKITDKCPAPAGDPGTTWCGATSTQPNNGFFVHFDLSYPSPSIPLGSFYPPVPVSYGFDDFGSWNVSFARVSCKFWSGYQNGTASIVDPSLSGIGNTGCCPLDPFTNNATTCIATSLKISKGKRLILFGSSVEDLISRLAMLVVVTVILLL